MPDSVRAVFSANNIAECSWDLMDWEITRHLEENRKIDLYLRTCQRQRHLKEKI